MHAWVWETMATYSAGASQYFHPIKWNINSCDSTLMLSLQVDMLEVQGPQSKKAIIWPSHAEGFIHTHAVDRDPWSRHKCGFLLGINWKQPPHMLYIHSSVIYLKDVTRFTACVHNTVKWIFVSIVASLKAAIREVHAVVLPEVDWSRTQRAIFDSPQTDVVTTTRNHPTVRKQVLWMTNRTPGNFNGSFPLPGVIKVCNPHSTDVHVSMSFGHDRHLALFADPLNVPNDHHLEWKNSRAIYLINVCFIFKWPRFRLTFLLWESLPTPHKTPPLWDMLRGRKTQLR